MPNKVLNLGVILVIFVAIVGLRTPKVQAQSAPLFENVTIERDFSSPLTLRGISGGSVPAQKVAGRSETVNGPCVGFVDVEPDHTLVLKDFFKYLRLQIQSPQDTTIIVRGPGGTWCNDDAEGKNPGIGGEWLAGSYDVWVGSFERDKYYPYILRITQEP
ncbi:hypothetical protein [Chroococcidiopsis sp. TS-821]|uniref:hypothetical protein n=1 Tax=Chroococcidiopsis sp. TS-821 TaxID=1378066 RepID=UPI000D4052D7|nr:hypothetical protein [Chroococcidiopsis sp. TS-821]PPS44120.1 hypothetical protein B1A85_09120 [Chroococcidiopsis sp. TS-821]